MIFVIVFVENKLKHFIHCSSIVAEEASLTVDLEVQKLWRLTSVQRGSPQYIAADLGTARLTSVQRGQLLR